MDTLLVPCFTTKRPVPVASIEYLKAMGNYTLLHLTNEKPILTAITLKRFAERLPGFLRIHKGTLVNPAHIVTYEIRSETCAFVELSQARLLTVSRRQTRHLKPQLTSFPTGVSAG